MGKVLRPLQQKSGSAWARQAQDYSKDAPPTATRKATAAAGSISSISSSSSLFCHFGLSYCNLWRWVSAHGLLQALGGSAG